MTDGRFWHLVDLFETEAVKNPEKHGGFRSQIPAGRMETLTAVCVYYNKGDFHKTKADLNLFLRGERLDLIDTTTIQKYVNLYTVDKKYYAKYVRDYV